MKEKTEENICEICEGAKKTIVSCLVKKKGEIIPMIVAPCQECKE